VHPSNFRVTGFTERPTLDELVALGLRFRIPVVEDLGSGYLGPSAGLPFVADEPEAPRSVAAGADVVCFSGDKLLGGPQAGIIVGKPEPLARIRKHPLMRALRADKMTYAALEATLQAYAEGRAAGEIPVARMIALTREEIAARARPLADALRRFGFDVELKGGVSTIGGGSAPGSELPTTLVSIARSDMGTDALSARLRSSAPPLIARIEGDRLMLDLRTVLDDEELLKVLERHAPLSTLSDPD
jgi:L-seryl-tRNA(Ser) seleniumtransferase